MELKELMIGNLVFFKSDYFQTEIITVGRITEKGVVENGRIIEFLSDGLHGIPLSETWLKRFGFEKEKDLWSDELFDIQQFSDGSFNFIPNGDIEVELKYVHQLQNLYYALYETELQQ